MLKYVMFYKSFLDESVPYLTMEEIGELTVAMMKYAFYGEETQFKDRSLQLTYAGLKPLHQNAEEKYEQKKAAWEKSAEKRAEKRAEKSTLKRKNFRSSDISEMDKEKEMEKEMEMENDMDNKATSLSVSLIPSLLPIFEKKGINLSKKQQSALLDNLQYSDDPAKYVVFGLNCIEEEFKGKPHAEITKLQASWLTKDYFDCYSLSFKGRQFEEKSETQKQLKDALYLARNNYSLEDFQEELLIANGYSLQGVKLNE